MLKKNYFYAKSFANIRIRIYICCASWKKNKINQLANVLWNFGYNRLEIYRYIV